MVNWLENRRPVGTRSFLVRLKQWADSLPHRPAIKWRSIQSGANEFTCVAYRLTEYGRRLLYDGLEAPFDAPPMFAGGCELYTDGPVWVRYERDEDRIGPFEMV